MRHPDCGRKLRDLRSVALRWGRGVMELRRRRTWNQVRVRAANCRRGAGWPALTPAHTRPPSDHAMARRTVTVRSGAQASQNAVEFRPSGDAEVIVALTIKEKVIGITDHDVSEHTWCVAALHAVNTAGAAAARGSWCRARGGAVVRMYRDHGDIRTKTLGFDVEVKDSLGLEITRTSVDHGQAFNSRFGDEQRLRAL